jgi:alkaline ceramidase TOD1/glycosyltransferase MUCI70-like protein
MSTVDESRVAGLHAMVCYTTIFGPYDRLADPPVASIPMVCFTDQDDVASTVWRVVRVPHEPCTLDERVRLSRRHKILAQECLPRATVWIWIDANLKLSVDPALLARYVHRRDVATFRYPDTWGARRCAYEEAAACIERHKDSAELIEAQMHRYRRAGFPTNYGLAETSILVRRNTPAVRHLNAAWWSEIQAGSRRDQVSLPYVCWTTRTRYALLPGCRIDNPFARHELHRENIYRGAHRRVTAVVN